MSAPETKTFTIALGQMLVQGGEPVANLERALSLIGTAKRNAADLILLPEVLDCGWCDESAREYAEALPGGTRLAKLTHAAAAHKVHLCAGLTERESEKIYNSAVLISPTGDLLLKHRKVNELAIAKEIYSTGKSAQAVCPTELGNIGMMICADGFFVGEALTRSLATRGAELIISPCAWAVRPEHNQEEEPYGDLWRDVYGRVAKEHHLWIAGTSNVGEIRHGAWAGHPCVGCSMLVGPDGDVRASGAYREEEIVYAEINL